MYWIINKNIEFWPENKRLISLKNPAQSVTLTAPASHCLVLLLEATPELVSQQVFFKKCGKMKDSGPGKYPVSKHIDSQARTARCRNG